MEDFLISRRQSKYEKRKWLKITFDGVVKRFPNPPKDLDKILELARRRFGVLDKVLETGNFKAVIACQPGGGIGAKVPFV